MVLDRPKHQQKRAMFQHQRPLPLVVFAVAETEFALATEGHRGDHGIAAVHGLVVAVPALRILAAPVAIQEDGIELQSTEW
eukprot:CAMPEP_0178996528 /NCGR_PEP_ID=MMETSP0795-20121207/8414_1 /TAXON_ID=88552 /ORGANISM="Amoebophrya sp., Strain Ameob2" /LENGTH=80 /DNA_ID=CAMNT_0020688919 /DNA_START=282 /DNA_END=524 /DNA_ORIENTATION=+